MKKQTIIFNILFSFIISTPVLGIENSPIQRLDISNVLSSSNESSETPISLNFKSNSFASCYSVTLMSPSVISVYAGPGLPCVTPITTVSITPLATPGGLGVIFQAPNDLNINSGLYYSQVTMSENSPPVFDPNNGSVLIPGTILVTVAQN